MSFKESKTRFWSTGIKNTALALFSPFACWDEELNENEKVVLLKFRDALEADKLS